VLFVRPSNAPFIEQDLELLKRHYEVRTLDVFEKGRSLGNMLRVLWRMFRGTLWADVAFSWFADIHAHWMVRLSRVTGAKSVVVVGGYEVNTMPEFGYGLMLDPKSAKVVKRVLARAGRVLAVSKFIETKILETNRNAKVQIVYNGVDTEKIVPKSAKENLVVTVGSATRSLHVAKGLDTFAKVSALVPEARFVAIGATDDETSAYLRSLAPRLVFTGALSHEQTLSWQDRAKVCCQFSKNESFGMALAESMSLECVPVGSTGGALPELVGDVGFLVPFGDPDRAAAAVREALRAKSGAKARERIASQFSLKKRESQLLEIIGATEVQ